MEASGKLDMCIWSIGTLLKDSQVEFMVVFALLHSDRFEISIEAPFNSQSECIEAFDFPFFGRFKALFFLESVAELWMLDLPNDESAMSELICVFSETIYVESSYDPLVEILEASNFPDFDCFEVVFLESSTATEFSRLELSDDLSNSLFFAEVFETLRRF